MASAFLRDNGSVGVAIGLGGGKGVIAEPIDVHPLSMAVASL